MGSIKKILVFIAILGVYSGFNDSMLYANDIENQDPINFEVYPNPVQGEEFTIKSEVEVTEVTVLNILGQQVMHQKFIGETKINIQLEARDNGLFIVQIRTIDGRVATKRILFK